MHTIKQTKTFQELLKWIRSVELTDEQLDEALKEIDDDGSGEIDFEELATWFHTHKNDKDGALAQLSSGLGLGLALGISMDEENFHFESSSEEEDENEAVAEVKDAFSNLLAASFGGSHEVKGLSLGIFAPDNQFRVSLSLIVFNPACEMFILMCIFVNLISLLFQTPGENENIYVAAINFSCSMVFTVEMLLRIIVHGFLKNSPWFFNELTMDL